MDENQLDDVMEVVKQIDLNKQVIESDNEFESDLEDVLPEITYLDAVIEEVTRAIAIANESGITKGARHFRAKVHYLREVIEFDDIKLGKVHTDDNLADPFTNALAFPKHSEHTKNIGMLPASSLM
nr:hypothetical protein [Tanacetum cinerariifolium]